MTNDRRSSSCDPGPGRTLLTIGQDFFSIQDYVLRQYNASLHRNHRYVTTGQTGRSCTYINAGSWTGNSLPSARCDPFPLMRLSLPSTMHQCCFLHLLSFLRSFLRSFSTTTPVTSFYPAATMVYSDIQTLRGVDIPVDYGSGVEYAHGLAQAFPESGIQMGLWLNGTEGCQDILDGQWDDHIHHLLDSIASWKVPKVFLRVGYGAYNM